MLKLSKLTDYGTVILSVMARQEGRLYSAQEICDSTGIALPTVSKILKNLQKAGVLTSVRGAKGGYSLARAASKISVAAIIFALEGPIALTECSDSHQSCEQAAGCNIQGNWHVLNQKIHHALESVTLADMIVPATRPDEVMIPVASLYK